MTVPPLKKIIGATLCTLVLGCAPKSTIDTLPFTKQSEKTTIEQLSDKEKTVLAKPIIQQETTVAQVYGEHIQYHDFSTMPVDELAKNAVPPPLDLQSYVDGTRLSSRNPKVSDAVALEKRFLEQAQKIRLWESNQVTSKIGELSVHDAILLARDIVTTKIVYFDVDGDKEFLKKNGAHLPRDTYYHLGQGDCDKYADLFILSFKTIKKYNPQLEQVYVTREIGENILPHAWNAIIIPTKEAVHITQVDPTFYDDKENVFDGENAFDAERGFHLPNNERLFVAKFYRGISDYSTSFKLYAATCSTQLLDSQDDLVNCFTDMAFTAYMSHNADGVAEANKRYDTLGITERKDTMLYYSFSIAVDERRRAAAETIAEQFSEKYSDSFWALIVDKRLKNTCWDCPPPW